MTLLFLPRTATPPPPGFSGRSQASKTTTSCLFVHRARRVANIPDARGREVWRPCTFRPSAAAIISRGVCAFFFPPQRRPLPVPTPRPLPAARGLCCFVSGRPAPVICARQPSFQTSSPPIHPSGSPTRRPDRLVLGALILYWLATVVSNLTDSFARLYCPALTLWCSVPGYRAWLSERSTFCPSVNECDSDAFS